MFVYSNYNSFIQPGGGGGGGIHPPPSLDISRDNFATTKNSRTALSRLFSFESCATFDAIFVKMGLTVPKLRNVM